MDIPNRPLELMLVEDSEADIRLTEIALKQSSVPTRLTVARDGEQALEMLLGSGDQVPDYLPDLILLDLHMPKVGGVEVLKEIRADERLEKIPVVVLTSSDSEKDIFEAYELAVNCYVTKPVELKKFLNVVEMINDFWTSDESD